MSGQEYVDCLWALQDAPQPLRLGSQLESQRFHERYAIWFDNQRARAIAAERATPPVSRIRGEKA